MDTEVAQGEKTDRNKKENLKENCLQWSAGSRELGDCAARSATALVDGMLQGDRTEDERVTVTNVTRI